MDIDWYSNIVVGVRAELRNISAEVTKYDANTDKPYKEKLIEPKWFIFDTDIEIPSDCDYEDEKVELHLPDYDDNIGVFGISTARSDSSNMIYGVSINDIIDNRSKMSYLLRDAFDYNGFIGVFSVLGVLY